MKVTAETITDAQLHTLWRESVGTSLADVDPDLMHTCTAAANLRGRFSRSECEDARARCAEIWNARHGGES